MSAASSTRACSPPESRPTGIGELLGREEEAPRPAGDVDRPPAEDDLIALAAPARGAA